MAKPGTVNWPALRQQYVDSDDLGLRTLAAEHDLALTTVAEHSAAERWPALRDERQEQEANRASAELRKRLRRAHVDRVEQRLKTIEGLQAELLERVSGGITVQVVTDEKTGKKTNIRVPLDPNSLDAAVRAYVELLRVEQVLVGEAETVVETRLSDEDRELLAATLAERLRGEGDPAEIAAAFRAAGLELLGEAEEAS